jgi:hypothetical protein
MFARKTSAVTATALLLAGCAGGASRFAPAGPVDGGAYGAFARYAPDAGTAIKSITWGKLPAAKAGTAFKKPVAISLVVKGANGKAITGTYPNPIVIATTDKTGATVLLVNGKPASAKNPVTGSTSKVSLKYSGLAIVPATFSATTKGLKKPAKTIFTPVAAAIVYSGSLTAGAPEIDLIATSGAGSTGSFTATQAGWTGATFGKAFTYSFAAVTTGSPAPYNNCPGQSGAGYTVTPGSGTKGTAFTVTAASAAVAGECTLTLKGGAGKTLAVLLTFTTTSVGINGEHAPAH